MFPQQPRGDEGKLSLEISFVFPMINVKKDMIITLLSFESTGKCTSLKEKYP